MTDRPKTKSAFIIRDFNDAGDERNYTAGAIEQIEAGAFGNYEAAGLVRAPTAEERSAAVKTDPATAKPAA